MIIAIIVMTIFMSLLMFGFGRSFMKMPPDKINYIYGYRSKMSMKNQNTWNFAHKYAGKVWVYSSALNVIISAIVVLIFRNTSLFKAFATILLAVIQPITLLLVISLTEKALKKNFDKNGNLIENSNLQKTLGGT